MGTWTPARFYRSGNEYPYTYTIPIQFPLMERISTFTPFSLCLFVTLLNIAKCTYIYFSMLKKFIEYNFKYTNSMLAFCNEVLQSYIST